MALFQTDSLWIQQVADGVAAVVLDLPSRPHNLLTCRALADLNEALERVVAASFRLMILRSGKPASFCHGMDLEEVASWQSPVQAEEATALGQALCRRLLELPVPSIAVIGGACLGAGLELALACDYRVVIDKPSTLLGFTQAELGLMPAWGGIQRSLQTVGLERSMPLLLGSRRLSAREAVAWGLADEISTGSDDEPPSFVAHPGKRPMRPLPLRTWRQKMVESTLLGRWLVLRGAERVLAQKLPEEFPGPHEALDNVRTVLRHGPEPALEHARKTLGSLAESEAHRNLMRLALGKQRLRAQERLQLRRVALVAAGTNGPVLAHWLVTHGCHVVIREADETALGMAMFGLLTQLQQSVARGTVSTGDLTRCLSMIHGTTAWMGFDDVELVLEASGDKPQAEMYRQIEKHVPDNTILACTSPVAALESLAQDLQHKERLAGLHFLPPPESAGLVEVVRGPATSPQTVHTLKQWLASLGKNSLVVRDSPGFLVLRLWLPSFDEAVVLLRQGMDVETIDGAMERFGMQTGPCAFMDRIGLDRLQSLIAAAAPIFQGRIGFDPCFAFMVEQGWLGKKASKGFYEYGRMRTRP